MSPDLSTVGVIFRLPRMRSFDEQPPFMLRERASMKGRARECSI